MIEMLFNDKEISIRRKSELLGFARANYYRALKQQPINKGENEEIKEEIEEIAMDMPSYGYRRITME